MRERVHRYGVRSAASQDKFCLLRRSRLPDLAGRPHDTSLHNATHSIRLIPNLQDAGLLGKMKGKENTQNKQKARWNRWYPGFGGGGIIRKVAISNPDSETVYTLCLYGFLQTSQHRPGRYLKVRHPYFTSPFTNNIDTRRCISELLPTGSCVEAISR